MKWKKNWENGNEMWKSNISLVSENKKLNVGIGD